MVSVCEVRIMSKVKLLLLLVLNVLVQQYLNKNGVKSCKINYGL
jgi:hypothetical protein